MGEGGELLESSDGGIIRHPRAFHASELIIGGEGGTELEELPVTVGNSGLNSHLFFFRFFLEHFQKGGSKCGNEEVDATHCRWDEGWFATAEAVGGCDIVSGGIGPFTGGRVGDGPKMPSPQGPWGGRGRETKGEAS
ncbi:hypothetical protein HPP92_007791 [Vanilla planifolia]|uniref:Uncharacterized protein n=1 Tax=Vanilla planifolia TaxID=51239 RepID=A0A835V9R5_VANPL|nr:hypothetical protein HPP92_007791 [Vanilla planifolia]